MSITTTILAFVGVMPIVAPKQAQTPDFTSKRRWHSRDRLDIRPVLWSLRNRPEDWKADGHYTLDHKPSHHEFWIANGFFFYSLYRTDDCSCHLTREGSFSLIQKVQFGRACAAWRRWNRTNENSALAEVNRQFANHFIPKQ